MIQNVQLSNMFVFNMKGLLPFMRKTKLLSKEPITSTLDLLIHLPFTRKECNHNMPYDRKVNIIKSNYLLNSNSGYKDLN